MKKMLPWLVTILLAITLIAVVAVFLFNQFFSEPKGEITAANAAASVEEVKPEVLSAKERVELTAAVTDIRTNLLDTDYIVVMDFAFQLDEKKAKEEFDELKDIAVKPIIIRTLSDMTAEELKGSKGKDQLNAKLINLINPELPHGKITKIEITNFIITRI